MQHIARRGLSLVLSLIMLLSLLPASAEETAFAEEAIELMAEEEPALFMEEEPEIFAMAEEEAEEETLEAVEEEFTVEAVEAVTEETEEAFPAGGAVKLAAGVKLWADAGLAGACEEAADTVYAAALRENESGDALEIVYAHGGAAEKAWVRKADTAALSLVEAQALKTETPGAVQAAGLWLPEALLRSDAVAVEEQPAEEAVEEMPVAIEESLEEATYSCSASGNSILLIVYSGGYSSYTVYRSVNGGAYTRWTGFGYASESSTVATWTDSDIIPGNTYAYRVGSPYSSSSYSYFIQTNTVTASTTYVANIRAKAVSGSSIQVTWNRYPGAYNYRIYRSITRPTQSGVSGMTLIGTALDTGADHLSWTDTGLASGTQYFYRILAYGSSYALTTVSMLDSATTDTVTVSLGALSAEAVSGTTRIKLSWSAYPGDTSYRVYRSTSSTVLSSMNLLDIAYQNSYEDSETTGGYSYFYRVVGVPSGAVSDYASAVAQRVVVTGLTAEPVEGSSDIILEWNAFTGATTYDIYRSTYSAQSMTLIDTVTGTSYRDTNTTGGSSYYYRVEATGITSGSSYSYVTANYRQLPTKVNAYGGLDSIAWDRIPFATYQYTSSTGSTGTLKLVNYTINGYGIEVSSSPNGPFENYATMVDYRDDTPTVVYADKTIADATLRDGRIIMPLQSEADRGKYFRVSIGAYGFSQNLYNWPIETYYSNTVYTGEVKVGTVNGITGKPVDTNAARITWSAASSANGYQLFRADSENGEYKWIKNCTTTVVNNYSLTPGADYWYKVRPYREYAEGTRTYGEYSDSVHVHILGTIDNLTVRGLDTNCAFLKWDKVAGATGYQVFRTVAGSGEYIWVKNCTTAQIANYDLTAGTTYYYKLRAYIDLPDGSRAYGQYSGGVKVDILPQAVITSVSFDGAVQLSWERIPGVTGYQIFYLQESTDGIYKWVMNCVPDSVTSTKVTKNLVYGTNFYFRVRGYIDYPDDQDHPRYYGQFSGADHTAVKFNLTRPELADPTFGKDGISLSWTNEDGDVDGYEVLYKVAGEGDFVTLAETGRDGLSWSWKGCEYGKSYYFQVRSFKKDSTGIRQYSSASPAKSCLAKFVLTTPVVTGAVFSANGITVDWTDEDTGVDGFELYYKVSGAPAFSFLSDLSADAVSYIWSKYGFGTTYYFQVRAYKLDGKGVRQYSGFSKAVGCKASLTATMRSARGKRHATSGKALMYISWDDIPGINSWEIQYNAGSGWTKYDNVTENTPSDGATVYNDGDYNLSCGVAYRFRVRGKFTHNGAVCYTEWSPEIVGSMPKLTALSNTLLSSSYYAYVKLTNAGSLPLTVESSCLVRPLGSGYSSYLGMLTATAGPTVSANSTVSLQYRLYSGANQIRATFDNDQEVFLQFTYNGYKYSIITGKNGPEGYGFWACTEDLNSNGSATH